MRYASRLAALAALLVVMLAVSAAPIEAQRHRPPARPHGSVMIYGQVGYPYWGPYYWGLRSSWWYPYPYGPYYDYSHLASIRVQAQPTQAQVYVDGYYTGIVDDFDGVFQRLWIRPGDHEITLYLAGYTTYRESIRVGQGKSLHLRHTMAPLPAGAPQDPPPLPKAEPKQEGAEDEPPVAAPPPGRRPLPPRAPLDRPEPGVMQAREFGTLSIRVQPAGAEVLIDGERWQGPDAQERLIVQVSEGTHRVEIRMPGRRPFTGEVTVRRGETATVNVSLPPDRE